MQTEKKKVIDTYEATYVQVDETHIEELREVPEFARVGEYYMYGEEVSTQGFKGFFVYADKETMYMARSQMNLADGDLPEEKNEIVVSKEWLSKFSQTVISVIQLPWIRKVFRVSILFQVF